MQIQKELMNGNKKLNHISTMIELVVGEDSRKHGIGLNGNHVAREMGAPITFHYHAKKETSFQDEKQDVESVTGTVTSLGSLRTHYSFQSLKKELEFQRTAKIKLPHWDFSGVERPNIFDGSLNRQSAFKNEICKMCNEVKTNYKNVSSCYELFQYIINL